MNTMIHELEEIDASAIEVLKLPERRDSARSKLFVLVQDQGPEPMWAWDISLGGMQCKSKRPRWPGTFLDLSFALPDSREKVQVGGQVVSLDECRDGIGMGLRFCRLSHQAQLMIYRFLDRRRGLWDPKAAFSPSVPRRLSARHPELASWLDVEHPFAAMLLEAQAALRAKQLRFEANQYALRGLLRAA